MLVFLADYFSEGNNDSEDSELRFDTCQSLWKQIKSETEVSAASFNSKHATDFISELLRVVNTQPFGIRHGWFFFSAVMECFFVSECMMFFKSPGGLMGQNIYLEIQQP